jgi:hypothetical protein
VVGLLGLLGLLCPSARAQTGPSVESAIRELFNSGQLAGMEVSGSVVMETGTDLSVTVTTLVQNNGFGLETSFSVSDGRCDFREVQLAAKASITLPDAISEILKMLNVPDTITVADERRSVSFLPENGTALVDSQSFDISDWTDANTQRFLKLVGADATFTVKNAQFTTTGMSFQLFMSGSVLDPTAGLCSPPYKALAQAVSSTLCTEAGGIEIAPTNLGLELRKWLLAAGQNVAYISAEDGTIMVGDVSAGSLCSLAPVKFDVNGKLAPGETLSCLSDATRCTDAARQAMIDGINAQLPDGYKIDASQFANVDVTYDPNTRDVTVGGELFAGAGKDPAALVDALKRYLEKSGGLDINGQEIKNVDVDDQDALATCKITNGVDAAVCNPTVTPGSARIPGTKGFGPLSPSAGSEDGEAADMTGDNDARRGDQTMLVLGSVLITLAVVAAIGGAIMAIKMFNKRRAAVSAGNFRSFNDGGFRGQGAATPADAFDQVMIEPRSQQQQPVWGDVVKNRNNTDPADYA